MLRSILDTFFPRGCLGCGGPGWPFCPVCERSVAVFSPPGCGRCGRPLDREVPRCADCPPPPVAWARAAFLYEGPARRALMKLKFGGLRSASSAFAPAMVDALVCAPPGPAAEGALLTWVPLGRRRARARGFDQAEALARPIARLTGRPVKRLLVRTRDTAPQAQRVGSERRRALDGAFAAVGRPPDRIILVDDVLTSGATAAACARALLAAGACNVGVLTAARALGSGVPPRCYPHGSGGSG